LPAAKKTNQQTIVDIHIIDTVKIIQKTQDSTNTKETEKNISG